MPPSQVLRAEMMNENKLGTYSGFLNMAQPLASILAGAMISISAATGARCLARFYCVCSTWVASYHQSSAFTRNCKSIIESENYVRISKGIITKITAKYIILEANGIGYILHVANPMLTQVRSIKKLRFMCTKLFVRMPICSTVFAQKMRKALSQSDLGLRDWSCVALAIIAADDNAGLVQAIETKNITYLTKFPKIGRKQPSRWCWTWKAR